MYMVSGERSKLKNIIVESPTWMWFEIEKWGFFASMQRSAIMV